MTVPTPEPQPQPHVPPAVEPQATAPLPTTQAAPTPATSAAPTAPAAPRVVVRSGPYWGGVVATALVAALVGIVGVLVFQEILDVDVLAQDVFGFDNDYLAYAVGGALVAVVAGALLQVLALATPRPRAFFGWIMGLGTLVAALLPLSWEGEQSSQLCTGLVNLLVGIAIWSLLSSTLSRTATVVR